MFIIRNRKIFFAISSVLVIASIAFLSVWGLNLGIDFTGGSILELTYKADRPTIEQVRTEVEKEGIEGASVRPSGEAGFTIRSRQIDEEKKVSLVGKLSFGKAENITVEKFNSIGPVAGKELQRKSFLAIAIVILAILFFIVFAFRKVSKPVSSWKYGVATIISLVHDVVIPTGIFVILGHYLGIEIDLLFVAALLSIMGYSVHDTIVVFDRIRENLLLNIEERNKENFDVTVGKGLMQTIGRSINTSLTTILVLITLYFFGGEATKNFALILLIGMLIGAYSSIFLAAPLLVLFEGKNKKN